MPEYVKVARLAVPVGWRVIVVSDLFLGAKRTETSGSASVELACAPAVPRAREPLSSPATRSTSWCLPVATRRQHSERTGSWVRHSPATWRPTAAAGRSCFLATAIGRSSTTRPRLQLSSQPASKLLSPRSCRWRPRRGPNRSASNPAGDSTSATPLSTRPTRVRHAARPPRRGGDPARAGRIKLALARRHRPADRSFGLAPFRGLTSHLPPRRPMALVALGSHRGGTVCSRLPDYWLFGVPRKLEPFSSRLLGLGLTLVVEVIVAGLVLVLVNHRVWHSAGRSLLGPSAHHANDRAREASRRILAAGGVGLVTGHTLQPELAGRYRLLRKLGRVRRSRGGAGVAPWPAPGLRPHPTGLLGRDRGGSAGARKAPPRPQATSTR